MIVVFIGGASGSGKSTLAHLLSARMNQSGKTSQVISMDDYFLEAPASIDTPEKLAHYRNNTNFDQIDMFDLPMLTRHLQALHLGVTITKPIFDFPTNRRLTSEAVSPSDYLIIDGLFTLLFAKSLPKELEKLTVFVGTSWYRSLIHHRVTRDVSERARQPADVLRQERKYVGPSFFGPIANSKSGVDIDLLNDPHTDTTKPHPLESGVNDVITALEEKQKLVY